MQKDYKKLFSHLASPEPPDGLLDKIMLRIRAENKRRAVRLRLFIFSAAAIASAAAFYPLLNSFRAELSASGFMQFFSLLFSDFGIAAAYWQSFLMSLLEVLPVMNLAALLIIVLVFLGSLRTVVRDAPAVFAPMK